VGWGLCLPLDFERLVILDVLLTGLSILLEFWALVALRIREPDLARPYRVPGGLFGAVAIGLPPLGLIVATILRNRTEQVGATSALTIGLLLIGAGPAVYLLSRKLRATKRISP
jgi:amino acid transporter